MAVLARPAPKAVLLKQKQPNCQTSRFEPRTANSTLSRTINLSAAGPSHSQQKPVQWPFYQDQLSSNCRLINADAIKSFIFSKSRPNSRFIKASPQWPFYQCRSSQMARHPDLSHGLQIPHYPARSVYQRPGQAIFIKTAQWPFYQGQPQWPLYQGRRSYKLLAKPFSAKADPITVLSRPAPTAVLSTQKQLTSFQPTAADKSLAWRLLAGGIQALPNGQLQETL